MHRQFSLQPFSRHYSHSTNPFLDLLDIHQNSGLDVIEVTQSRRADLMRVLIAYKSVHDSGALHTLNFVTINDYLWLLRAVSQEMSVLRRSAMFYLAAAVSDFFLPRQKMVSYRRLCFSLNSLFYKSTHKIQSGKGSLHIEMDQVPKILKPLVQEWTRGGYIVSFKVIALPRISHPVFNRNCS